ncbi:uncharacterized protein K444DRAFT_661514 [Hyaloscypha bicolor E]|uniref:Uncharacterized protein n=1 Tax=Hyaloscypha bicolor E TaxID=1095630 RepID=A0A2J6TGZ6_9HELO|nr:uncharacterized protein K444DRAFT_661514 [Hyaloscypha bicolor E]PMD62312.1 hypothetical protein K444DRAFT_661514 [Hyaloscypha bicolor E]
MTQNYLELFIIDPKQGNTFHSPTTKQDFQWILNQCASGRGGISFSFRQSTTNPYHLLFVGCWALKADHDDLDLRGVTPKMLQRLMSRITVPPIAVYYLLMDDTKRREVEFDAQILGITAWHVREGYRGEFGREVERRGIRGAWYVERGVPPRPQLMPTDEIEMRIIEEGEKRTEARLEMPTPNIWVSFWTDDKENEAEEFRGAVKSFAEEMEGGKYEKFLSG